MNLFLHPFPQPVFVLDKILPPDADNFQVGHSTGKDGSYVGWHGLGLEYLLHGQWIIDKSCPGRFNIKTGG